MATLYMEGRTLFFTVVPLAIAALLALQSGVAMADDCNQGVDKMRVHKLRVAIVSRTFFYVPLWAAIANGDFAKAGMEIEISLFGNRSQQGPLLAKEIDIAIATPESVIQNAAVGGPLRIVAGNNGKPTHSLIARAPFKTVEALRGARIGILNHVEGTYFLLQRMLAHFGLHSPGDYHVVETGGVPLRHRAMLEGQIDAGLQSIPWSYVAEQAGMNNLGDVGKYVPDWQFVSINVNQEWAQANAEIVIQFLAVMLKSTAWVYAHRDEAATIAARELPTTLEYAQRAWEYYTSTNSLTKDISINRRGVAVVIAAMRDACLIPRDAPQSVDSYYDRHWLDAARERIATKN